MDGPKTTISSFIGNEKDIYICHQKETFEIPRALKGTQAWCNGQ